MARSWIRSIARARSIWRSLLTEIEDPLTHATTFAYDAAGCLDSVTDATNRQTLSDCNADGQVRRLTDPAGKITLIDYFEGDVTSVTDPLGRVTRVFVDGAGRTLAQLDPLSYVTRFEYDERGNFTRVIDARSESTRLTYDENANLLTLEDANTNVTTFTYDNMDLLQTRRDASAEPRPSFTTAAEISRR